MSLRLHFFPGLCLLILGLALQIPVFQCLLERSPRRRLIWTAAAASTALLLSGYFLEFQRVLRHFSVRWWTWLECASLVETICLIALVLALPLWRRSTQFDPGRRKLLQSAGIALSLAPVAAASVGMVRRNRFRLSEVQVAIPNLPKDLDGLRIAQITDIHLSPFLSERELAIAIDMANEARANLALVTGDLITRVGDPLDACLRQLARLRADSGILGCLGNHEIYTGTQNYVTEQGRRIGIEFLRRQARQLRFGNATINFAGVDYQRMHKPYLIGTERFIVPGALNVMLSHNPDVFPVAAAQGYQLTVAGHTHGGQVRLPFVPPVWAPSRYGARFAYGHIVESGRHMIVSGGLGCSKVPLRLGVPPEIVRVTLG